MSNWKLFREMDHFRKEMDELFRGLGNEPVESAFFPGVGSKRFPRVNLGEDADNFYLEALLPGVDENEIDLSITGNTLTLSGERQSEIVADSDQTWHRRERGFGKFMRTIELPADIDTKVVTAEYRNGLLKVSLGKAEAAKPKRISIASH